jgi:serine/threonine protein kinase
MAPEQADQEQLDIRTDLYSLGAVTYEMLSARPPFEDNKVMQLMLKIAEEDPVDLSRYRPGLMDETRDLVMRCLEKKPARRYQTPQELINQLQGITPDSGVSTEGWLYQQAVDAFDQRDYQKALEICERVIRINPNYQDVQGMQTRAKRQLVEESSQRIDRLIVQAKKALADNRWNEVKTLSRQILTLNPDNKEAPELLEQLPEVKVLPAHLLHNDGTRVVLEGEYFRVGRDSTADLDLTGWDQNKFCSRNHSEILFQDGKWMIKPHDEATNPTKLNNTVISRGDIKALEDGDQVTFADIDFTYQSS